MMHVSLLKYVITNKVGNKRLNWSRSNCVWNVINWDRREIRWLCIPMFSTSSPLFLFLYQAYIFFKACECLCILRFFKCVQCVPTVPFFFFFKHPNIRNLSIQVNWYNPFGLHATYCITVHISYCYCRKKVVKHKKKKKNYYCIKNSMLEILKKNKEFFACILCL